LTRCGRESKVAVHRGAEINKAQELLLTCPHVNRGSTELRPGSDGTSVEGHETRMMVTKGARTARLQRESGFARRTGGNA